MKQLHCNLCSKPASTEIPDETIVRGWIECPECAETQQDNISKREILLEEVRRSAESLLDHLSHEVMPPWRIGGPEFAEIMIRLIRSLRATDEDFFNSRSLLLRAMQLQELKKCSTP